MTLEWEASEKRAAEILTTAGPSNLWMGRVSTQRHSAQPASRPSAGWRGYRFLQ
jgi:hypothetical protein